MAIAVSSQSSLTLSGSEQTCGSAITTGKTAVCQIDLHNNDAATAVELRVYVKTAGSGDTARVLYTQSWYGTTDAPIVQTPPIPAPYSVEFKVIRVAGSGTPSIPYVVFTID